MTSLLSRTRTVCSLARHWRSCAPRRRLACRGSETAPVICPRDRRPALLAGATRQHMPLHLFSTTSAQQAVSDPDEMTLEQHVEKLAMCRQTALSVQQFVDFANSSDIEAIAQSVRFMINELPIRFSHFLKTIDELPSELRSVPAVEGVRGMYLEHLRDVLAFRHEGTKLTGGALFGPNIEDIYVLLKSDSSVREEINTQMCDLCMRIRKRDTPLVVTIARGIHQLLRSGATLPGDKLASFLDSLYMNRISIRLLLSQYLELFCRGRPMMQQQHDLGSASSMMRGVFDEHLDVKALVERAARHAQAVCKDTYGLAPPVEIRMTKQKNGSGPLIFSYVPGHLFHILFELLKNSLRATVEFHRNSSELPAVQVVIVKATKDLSIKIADRGGGVARRVQEKLFTYAYTTFSGEPLDILDGGTSGMNDAPMAGLGYGLPISRLYARYFGGELRLISTEGYGTDAYIYLHALASKAREALPAYSGTSHSQAQTTERSPSPSSKQEALSL